MRFHVPSFKAYATSELQSCGKSAWPAVSVTGGECSLACDHCQAKILEPMLPARTPEADAMSRDLKKRGFSFVGSTICYAFMQAAGMFNDHLAQCFRCREVKRRS